MFAGNALNILFSHDHANIHRYMIYNYHIESLTILILSSKEDEEENLGLKMLKVVSH